MECGGADARVLEVPQVRREVKTCSTTRRHQRVQQARREAALDDEPAELGAHREVVVEVKGVVVAGHLGEGPGRELAPHGLLLRRGALEDGRDLLLAVNVVRS